MSVKGGGAGVGYPPIRNLFFGENFVRKGGGGTPLTDKIRKVVFDVAPKRYEIMYQFVIFSHRILLFYVTKIGRRDDGGIWNINMPFNNNKTGEIHPEQIMWKGVEVLQAGVWPWCWEELESLPIWKFQTWSLLPYAPTYRKPILNQLFRTFQSETQNAA